MNLRDEICYHCGKPATTTEHVPPTGLFPKEKSGRPARVGPLEVPSCALHNNGKSRNDEYLRMLIAGVRWESVPASIKETIIRSVKRRPALAHMILSDSFPRANAHEANSAPSGSIYDADGARIIEWLEAVARGVIYHHYRRVMNRPVWVLPEFSVLTPQAPAPFHVLNSEARDIAKAVLNGRPLLGDHRRIFTYRYCEQAVELNFYSSIGAFVLFEE